MRIIDSFSEYFGLNDVDTSEQNETTEIATEEASPASDFSNLLSMFTAGQSSASTDSEAGISQMQSQLMSSLGVAGLGVDTLTDLVSDDNLASMQSTFLTMLQADLFSSASDSASDTVSSAQSTDVASVVEDGASTWDAFMNFGFGDDGVDLSDGFDAVNLLNHIPIVSDVYQSVSSTDISAVSDLAGSFLYGGPAGLAYSAVNLTVEGITGDSIVGNLWSMGDEWLFEKGVVSESQSLAETVAGKSGEAVASNAYSFARRQFDVDESAVSGN
ncbi:hypothetical protein [Alteromonas sp. C1M14]|uniref:hypothetical protein n=1 Tax=Alteromonas sp. C1M14 TaxID=2841567 RepID=UPI001C0861BF|nr:hypothetical protein [Alteromonas sp. C1M14]MBU2980108.1 hypothetical protein [Alteromonas sp. C1M14]